MTAVTSKSDAAATDTATSTLLIDTDVHERWSSISDIFPYLDQFWQRQAKRSAGLPHFPGSPYLPPVYNGGTRREWQIADRAVAQEPGAAAAEDPLTQPPARTDLATLQRHLFDEEQTSIGILDGFVAFASLKGSYEFASALAAAYNDWQIDKWLEPEPRLRGSVHITTKDPQVAAREIDRVGGHPQIVQVFLPTLTDTEFGDPFYRPIFEAALRNDLVVTMHHHSCTQTVLGYPRYYVSWHSTVAPFSNMAQLVGLIFCGVFDRYPELKVVVNESGVAWVPWFMWRLDEQYREHRGEVPWVKRLPSEIMRENIRVSTQPMSDITARQFVKLVEMVESDRIFVFASDYPHYDADSAYAILPTKTIPEELRLRIRYQNALETYPKLRDLAP
jgi:predicted TIM-barrel fold metal-dependent hydrolase